MSVSVSNLPCIYPGPAREMSTESFPLQPLEQNGDHDKGNADPGYLHEPLENATKPGTKSTRKVQSWKDWPWKRILNTVVSLLGYAALFTGISMIAPFYPILVSSTYFLSPPPSLLGIRLELIILDSRLCLLFSKLFRNN